MLGYGFRSEVSQRVPLTITCQWCGCTGPALAWSQTDWVLLLHLIPIFRWRNVFVECQTCKRDFLARCSVRELQQANPLTLQHYLVKRVSFVGKVCALLGLFLCWAPLIGIIPATIALLTTRRHPSWVAKVSVVAFILSVLFSLLFLVLLLIFSIPSNGK